MTTPVLSTTEALLAALPDATFAAMVGDLRADGRPLPARLHLALRAEWEGRWPGRPFGAGPDGPSGGRDSGAAVTLDPRHPPRRLEAAVARHGGIVVVPRAIPGGKVPPIAPFAFVVPARGGLLALIPGVNVPVDGAGCPPAVSPAPRAASRPSEGDGGLRGDPGASEGEAGGESTANHHHQCVQEAHPR